MEFEKVNVILSEINYSDCLKECKERCAKAKKKNNRIIWISILAALALLIFFYIITTPLFTFTIFIVVSIIVLIVVAEGSENENIYPDKNIYLSHMLNDQKYRILDMIIHYKDTKTIKVILEREDKVVENYYLELSDYELFYKTDIQKTILDLSQCKIMIPYKDSNKMNKVKHAI